MDIIYVCIDFYLQMANLSVGSSIPDIAQAIRGGDASREIEQVDQLTLNVTWLAALKCDCLAVL